MEDGMEDENNPVSMEALERTAAWVQEVSKMKVEPMHADQSELKETDQFGSMYSEFLRDQLESSAPEIDIPKTVKEFKEVCEKLGISQRFAAKHIMEKTSQGNLSFLLDKGRHKKWNELSPRGRIPYIRMRRWLDNESEKRETTSLLTQTKEYKKTGPKDGGCRREKFTIFQLMVLCRFFEEDPNPNQATRVLLAEKLDASVERITIWFQNQRARGFPAQRVLSQSNFTRKSVDVRNLPQSPLLNMIGHDHEHLNDSNQSNVQYSFSAAHSKDFNQPGCNGSATSPHNVAPVAAHSQNFSKPNLKGFFSPNEALKSAINPEKASMGAYYNEFKITKQSNGDSDDDQPLNFSISKLQS